MAKPTPLFAPVTTAILSYEAIFSKRKRWQSGSTDALFFLNEHSFQQLTGKQFITSGDDVVSETQNKGVIIRLFQIVLMRASLKSHLL